MLHTQPHIRIPRNISVNIVFIKPHGTDWRNADVYGGVSKSQQQAASALLCTHSGRHDQEASSGPSMACSAEQTDMFHFSLTQVKTTGQLFSCCCPTWRIGCLFIEIHFESHTDSWSETILSTSAKVWKLSEGVYVGFVHQLPPSVSFHIFFCVGPLCYTDWCPCVYQVETIQYIGPHTANVEYCVSHATNVWKTHVSVLLSCCSDFACCPSLDFLHSVCPRMLVNKICRSELASSNNSPGAKTKRGMWLDVNFFRNCVGSYCSFL